ncbi:MAG: HTH domain-containing protein [Defluviitaleaceae bacterium]|nr:HTH domain-containing protein [Defluviitaleaceae bacterium]
MGVNERRAEIKLILEGRRIEQRKNLAARFGVSERTIRYDIEALSAEYPIETVRGNGGGIRLMDGYGVYKGDISEDQQNALLKALSVVDKESAKQFCELLLAHGSHRNKSKIEEAIRHLQQENAN